MNRRNTHIGWLFLSLILLFAAGCTKMDSGPQDSVPGADKERYENGDILKEDLLAVATLRSKEGVRYLQLDPVSIGFIINPDDVLDVADGTRIFLQYKSCRVTNQPDFCTESVWVDWVSPLDVGTVGPTDRPSDPVDIVNDWITSLEDGFLTLHYMIPASGRVKHGFTLSPTEDPCRFLLVHDAQGETEGSLTDGIVCFPVDGLLPDTGGETVTLSLSLSYLNLKNTLTTLTVDYRTAP